jgi:hypothetical protein
MRIVLAVLMLTILLACQAPADKIEYQTSEEGVLFSEDGDNILFYQRAPKSFDGKYTRNNYVHPLWSLDGDTLTEDYPPDHAHHRGIFWTWHQIYVGDKSLGDAWECRDFIWDVTALEVSDAAGDSKMLEVTVLWKSPDYIDEGGEMIPAVEENTRIIIYPRDDEVRIIDFEIELLALQENVTIGGSKDRKGYGGFSPRIKCPDDLIFKSVNGDIKPKTTAVQAGAWMNMIGSFNGECRSGIAILCHPDNPAPIDRWILRAKKSMQNPVYPGRERAAVSNTQPTILRYRLILQRDESSPINVHGLYERYKNGRH